MQTVETGRWSGPEAIENLASLQAQTVNQSLVIPKFAPNHVHREPRKPASYLKPHINYSLEELLKNEWIDYQIYFGTRQPSTGRWGGGVECWFNLNTSRVEGSLYRVDIVTWHRSIRNVRRRLTGEVRRQAWAQIGDLVIFEKSQQLVSAMVEARV